MKSKLVVLAAAVLIAWGLKRHYASARPDDLLWILSPTAWLVGVISGATFAFQPGEGYLSREHLFLIEKSCAGINFMVAAFGMLVFSLFHRAGSGLTAAAQVLGASLLAMALYQLHLYFLDCSHREQARSHNRSAVPTNPVANHECPTLFYRLPARRLLASGPRLHIRSGPSQVAHARDTSTAKERDAARAPGHALSG